MNNKKELKTYLLINRMNKYMKRLPEEVINLIIPYTYLPQNENLQKDIISYTYSLNVIINIFKERYQLLIENNNKVLFNHLLFHIYNFMIGLKNTYSNCQHIFFKIYNRNYKKNISNFNSNYNINNLKNEFTFRVYWGLLTPDERNQFIYIHKQLDINRSP